jgi:hypothetical protein
MLIQPYLFLSGLNEKYSTDLLGMIIQRCVNWNRQSASTASPTCESRSA